MRNIKFIAFILIILACSIAVYATEEKFGGIGAHLYKDSVNKKLIIIGLVPNSPAEYLGLPIGGVVEKINGEKTKNISINKASFLIRGEVGTKVDLIIKYNGKRSNYSIARAQIVMPEDKVDERYMIHWKQIAPKGFENAKSIHPDVYKALSKQEQQSALLTDYWATRKVKFKRGYDACLSYQKNEQNSCLMNLVNREIAQTENDRQAELQEALIQQQARQNYINNINQTMINNSLQDINNSIRNTNYNLNNINNSLRRW